MQGPSSTTLAKAILRFAQDDIIGYSSLSATMGSTRAALDAGTALANNATPTSTATTTPNVKGSVGLTL